MRSVAAISSTGSVRLHNEDCVSVFGEIIREGVLRKFAPILQYELLLIADGMGGHAKGEVASRLAVKALNNLAPKMRSTAGCVNALRTVNRQLYAAMDEDETLRGMGTTVVGTLIHNSHAIWFNVGDSRAYILRETFQQLSVDHVPEWNRTSGHRRSHAITQSLGGSVGFAKLDPAIGAVKLSDGDTILLCSDGLTDVLTDEEIAMALRNENAADMSVRNLLDTVMSKGAHDNVSIIVASA